METRGGKIGDELVGWGDEVMAIKGYLREANLFDVLQMLSLGQKTGKLSLVEGKNLGDVYFKDGKIIYALLNNQEPTTPQDIEEIIYTLMDWKDGSFNFEPDHMPPEINFSPLDLGFIILEGAKRIDEWEIIRESLPSLDIVFDRVEEESEKEEVILSEEEREVLDLVDGYRDARNIIEVSGYSEFEVCRALSKMLKYNLIENVRIRKERIFSNIRELEEHKNLGIAFLLAERYNDALEEYERILKIDPNNSEARFYLALTFYKQGDYERAIKEYERALKFSVKKDKIYNNLGLAWEKKGHLDKASNNYRKAVELDSECYKGYNNLGRIDYLRGDYEEAIENYRKALALKPDLSESYFYLGLICYKKGLNSEAIKMYQKAREISDEIAELHSNLGYALEREGRLDEARREYESACSLDPDLIQAHNNLGNIYYRNGAYDKAVAKFIKGIELAGSQTIEAHYKLGNIYYKRGMKEEAITEWEKALKIDLAHGESQEKLKRAIERIK